mgnify:FL=1
MKTFKQFSKQINENRENLMELDRELTAAGILAAKYGPKIVKGVKAVGPFAVQKGKQLLSIANKGMNALDKTYGSALYATGGVQGTKSAIKGKPGEALRNFSAMIPGGRVFNKLKKFKNLGRLGSTAQSFNRYSTNPATTVNKYDPVGRVVGGTLDKLTNDKYDFDGRGKSKKK